MIFRLTDGYACVVISLSLCRYRWKGCRRYERVNTVLTSLSLKWSSLTNRTVFLNYKTVLLAFIASFLADLYFLLRLLMCFTICGSLKPGALRNADCCFMILDVFHFYRRVASAKHGTFVTSEHIAASVIMHFEVWKFLYLLAWSRSLILCHIAPTCLLDDSSDEVMYIQMFCCTALHAIAPLLLTKVMFVDYLDSVL